MRAFLVLTATLGLVQGLDLNPLTPDGYVPHEKRGDLGLVPRDLPRPVRERYGGDFRHNEVGLLRAYELLK